MPLRPIKLSRIRTPNVMSLADVMGPQDDGTDEVPFDAKTNAENRDLVVREWQLGPEKASPLPDANPEFWQGISAAWNVDEATARTRFCANCEFFDNSPEEQAEMLAVPIDQYDMDGGGRGYCEKFDFICHSLRVCQAWECDADEGDTSQD